VPVTITRCFTNTYPEISCTNVVLNPTTVSAREALMGNLTISSCDQSGAFSNAVFEAGLLVTVRTNDFVGTHDGVFKILSGTNVLASGFMSGISGLPCGQCNHFEGALHGTIWAAGLRGAKLEADYAANLTDITNCPSATLPQGTVVMVIDGVTVIPCPSSCVFGSPRPPGPGPLGTATTTGATSTVQY
jgi:hypothetical protein